MNQVILLGNLCADAETRYTQSGDTVISFRMATNLRYRDRQGELRDLAEFHQVESWNSEKIADYLTKGKQVLVTGSLRTSRWEDSEGNPRSRTFVRAQRIQLLGGPRNGDTGANETNPEKTVPLADDDIPF